jgi:hypothetical protein
MPGYCAFPVSKTKLVASQQTVHACGQPATRIIFRSMEGRLAPCLAAVTRQKRGCTACSCFFCFCCSCVRGLISIMDNFLLHLCLSRVSFAVIYHGASRTLPVDVALPTTTPGLHPQRSASLCLLSDVGCMRDGECRMMMLRFHRVHCEVHDPLASIRLTLAPATRSSAPHAS